MGYALYHIQNHKQHTQRKEYTIFHSNTRNRMAMLKIKHTTFSLILVCLIVVSPLAKAQLLGGGGGGGLFGLGDLLNGLGLGGLLGSGGLGGLLGGLGLGGLLGGGGGGGGGLLGGLLGGGAGGAGAGGGGGILNIQGVLRCSVNGNLPPTGTSAPPFANAGVQLQCGRQNTVVATSTTNSGGSFVLRSNPIQTLLTQLMISNCRIFVTTPLATCDASLPLGNLVSQLAVVGNTITGALNVVNIAPTGFTRTTT